MSMCEGESNNDVDMSIEEENNSDDEKSTNSSGKAKHEGEQNTQSISKQLLSPQLALLEQSPIISEQKTAKQQTTVEVETTKTATVNTTPTKSPTKHISYPQTPDLDVSVSVVIPTVSSLSIPNYLYLTKRISPQHS